MAGRPLYPKDQARAQLEACLKAAREEAYLSPTFWTVAAYGDLKALQALWGPRATLAQAQEVLDLYRRASELGSEEQLRQVRDQVDFLIVMAGSEAKGRAGFLQALHDGLVAVDDGEAGDGTVTG